MAKYSLLKLQINTSQPSQVASQGGGAHRSHFWDPLPASIPFDV